MSGTVYCVTTDPSNYVDINKDDVAEMIFSVTSEKGKDDDILYVDRHAKEDFDMLAYDFSRMINADSFIGNGICIDNPRKSRKNIKDIQTYDGYYICFNSKLDTFSNIINKEFTGEKPVKWFVMDMFSYEFY